MKHRKSPVRRDVSGVQKVRCKCGAARLAPGNANRHWRVIVGLAAIGAGISFGRSTGMQDRAAMQTLDQYQLIIGGVQLH